MCEWAKKAILERFIVTIMAIGMCAFGFLLPVWPAAPGICRPFPANRYELPEIHSLNLGLAKSYFSPTSKGPHAFIGQPSVRHHHTRLTSRCPKRVFAIKKAFPQNEF
jgi:hypothetical protein